jgi:Nucleotidyl transferase AbiEii toxin, Type IV TA system
VPEQKPRDRSGYRPAETEQVKSACLTVAVTLGALMDELCIVGGLVPTLLIDHQAQAAPGTSDTHSGTNDLDIGLAVGLLNDHQYTEISRRLRQEGFIPDRNERGNPTPQRWKLANLNVTVDFLLPPIPGADRGGRVHNLEGDFGALIAPGLELAFDERHQIDIDARALTGEAVSRKVPVCGPGAFIVLKTLAFADRGEPKDAYDLTYVLRRWPGGRAEIAARISEHATRHPAVIQEALQKLARDFATPDSLGPQRAAAFEGLVDEDLHAAAADAHGYVDDLLRASRDRR